jgi:hypothetical protein
MVPSASIPAVRQNRSKLTETASQALSTAPIPVGGKAVNGVIAFFMALLSFRGISTPSLPAQGEQRRSSYFNIPRGNSTTPIQTNLMYDSLDACYAAEDKIEAEYARTFSQWIEANPGRAVPQFIKQRPARAICIPHSSLPSSD